MINRMFKPISLFIGLRYTRSKRRTDFISFMSLSSVLGIALGVTTLITVLSVMNGFEKELRTRILGMASHVTITGFGGTVSDWDSLAKQAVKHREVVGAAPFVEAQAMLTKGAAVRGVLVRGVDPAWESNVSELDRFMVAGRMEALLPGQFGILLGIDVARSIGATIGSKVTLVAPKASMTPVGVLPRLKRFTVVGLFQVGAAQYDSAVAVVNIQDGMKVFQLDGEANGIRIKLNDIFMAPEMGQRLAATFGGRYWVRDWTQHHANFFRALKIEKTVMFIILTLIIAVAAFNIVSALTMVVTDKEADIAILRTIGATPLDILRIFMIQGVLIGVVGTILGSIGGIILAANVEVIVPAIENFFGTKFLRADIYYISEVPSDLRQSDVVKISAISFLMSILATIYPALRAAGLQPAEALRYE